ncbi:TMEM175 family protein [Pediococcus claussenii]|uniref:Integral membrane protein n=1 Tax=Pediococcus claussenii (strain ATCC BAA-344 / DSM 14800 / JCM 18046 / KCTC 3811 / LMG 21948 / P06) TaxID=701521 RepID=G8PAK5_PEDCP|nr:TMEM175 family protein [Pediococcus claussenii]AEV95794.1 hypothetical protein PECL_1576 [Pediococcus claussenii ATCC BAA-344]ANZ69294.1 hypothetical protein AYR57_02800 [Pediococcus claussenii]ANZ71114.1 hypothetical protein AYR58_02815 [Pediococcus claussenii]KRN20402.1 hypothetical protein IV79_GL000457 [Pediococcus claussenii]
MTKERLSAFTDAIIAIIMTILVLDIPQPTSATWVAIWNLHTHFIAYTISFSGLAIMWNNIHNITQIVRRINGHVLWSNISMLFFASLFPYTTLFVADHFSSFVAELSYTLIFTLLSISYFVTTGLLLIADPSNEGLRYTVNRPSRIILDMSFKALGIFIGIWYPPIMLFSTLANMLIWIIPDRRAEKVANKINKINKLE